MGKKGTKFNSGWCFATMNGRLVEIYFNSKYGIYVHCYVERKEFNKRERKMIDSDIKKYQFRGTPMPHAQIYTSVGNNLKFG